MKKYLILIVIIISSFKIQAQTKQDSLEIKRVALAYIEAQHTPNPKLMESALHPRMVKRSVFRNKAAQKDYISEFFAENMVILAETYNVKGDKFPKNPRKEIKLLDVSAKTASVKRGYICQGKARLYMSTMGGRLTCKRACWSPSAAART